MKATWSTRPRAVTKPSRCLKNVDYDLVLTDLHMEGGDGLSVLNQIRRQAPLTISVVLTGFASVESAIAALQEGAYDYLVKPCDIDSMRTRFAVVSNTVGLMLAEQKARADLEQLNRDWSRGLRNALRNLRDLTKNSPKRTALKMFSLRRYLMNCERR